jgi:hypothetical protein
MKPRPTTGHSSSWQAEGRCPKPQQPPRPVALIVSPGAVSCHSACQNHLASGGLSGQFQ